MKETGELIEWNDDRGFGFVQPAAGARLFVHISAFERPLRRPQIGDRLAFSRGPGKDGRPAVVAAQIAGATQRPRSPGPSDDRIETAKVARALRLLAAAILLGAIIVLRLPATMLLVYLVMGAISFAAYWLDKQAAEAGRWRTAETTLHGIDLLGGIIGGLLAQAALHHKTAKPGFAAITFAIVVAHLILAGALAFRIVELPAIG